MKTYIQTLAKTLDKLVTAGLAKQMDYSGMSVDDVTNHFKATCEGITKADVTTEDQKSAYNTAVEVFNQVEEGKLIHGDDNDDGKPAATAAESGKTAAPAATAAESGKDKSGKAAKAPAKKKAAAKAPAKPRKPAVPKERKPRDEFGFLIGSLNHHLGKMLQRSNGVSMLEIKKAEWNENHGTMYNVMNALVKKGLAEIRKSDGDSAARYYATGKTVTPKPAGAAKAPAKKKAAAKAPAKKKAAAKAPAKKKAKGKK